jgi:hypothetical protein
MKKKTLVKEFLLTTLIGMNVACANPASTCACDGKTPTSVSDTEKDDTENINDTDGTDTTTDKENETNEPTTEPDKEDETNEPTTEPDKEGETNEPTPEPDTTEPDKKPKKPGGFDGFTLRETIRQNDI